MIFYNSQLMKDENQLRLFLVSNPSPFLRYEDHEAALQIGIHEMVERAIESKENPIALIEQYLQVVYNGGDTPEDIANFIINCHQMVHTMHKLKDNWDEMDDTLPEVSLKHSATSREQAVQVYYETTLRSYLEALSGIYNQQEG
jgi:hypothetical protein